MDIPAGDQACRALYRLNSGALLHVGSVVTFAPGNPYSLNGIRPPRLLIPYKIWFAANPRNVPMPVSQDANYRLQSLPGIRIIFKQCF